jgi:hypothetical protein
LNIFFTNKGGIPSPIVERRNASGVFEGIFQFAGKDETIINSYNVSALGSEYKSYPSALLPINLPGCTLF